MDQTITLAIVDVLAALYQGGRIDQFSTGNVYLTNIFGELVPFDRDSFNTLLQEELIQRVHLHLPGGECYKISPAGIAVSRLS